jgi:hypothetical protein
MVAAGITLLFTPAAAAARPVATVTLLAAGDVAACDSQSDEATAALVERELARGPAWVAALGDLAYDHGSAEELAACYEPGWGRFRNRTKPALGNHEYGTGTAAPAITLFGLPGNGWYSWNWGAWHVVVLNSNCDQIGGCGPGSPQSRWLRTDLAAHRTRCTLAYWHHARFSSGVHGSDVSLAHLWDLLAAARVDVALAGHDHHYERFAPMKGIRSFVVGTGGRSLRPAVARRPGSEALDSSAYGILRLRLAPRSYSWRFLPVAAGGFSDAGTGRCS